MTVQQYAEAIRRAEYQGDRETYLDLWEQVATNSSSTNRLYEAVMDEICRREAFSVNVDNDQP